ncbi:MAG: Flp family type IVb pilin, partial [Isosphaeraceae bacterium]
ASPPSYRRCRATGGLPPPAGSRHESGQGLIEYGVILVLMAVVCVVSLVFFGDQLSSLLSMITSAV